MPSMLRRAFRRVSTRSTSTAVTSRVACGVVDSLEAVDVDGDDAQVELGASAAGQFPVEVALEGTPVGAPGQRVAERGPLKLVGGPATGVDHGEVDEARDRPLSGFDSDQAPELDELLDDEDRRPNSRSPPRRRRSKRSPALDRDGRAGGVGRGAALSGLGRVRARVRRLSRIHIWQTHTSEKPRRSARSCSERAKQQLTLVGVCSTRSAPASLAPLPPSLGQRFDRGGFRHHVGQLLG